MATVPDDVLSSVLSQAHEWAARQGRNDEEREVARDAATERLVEALSKYDPARGDFGGYALRFIRPRVRQALARHRDKAHNRPPVAHIPDGCDLRASDLPSAGRVPMTAVLADLPADLRDAVRFRFIDGFALEDCALLLGCSYREARARLDRAAALLADHLPAEGD